MTTKFCVMIPTTKNRQKALSCNLESLINYINEPFTIYIYNDLAPLIKPMAQKILKKANRKDINLIILNDNKEYSSKQVGCSGARYYLLEKVKKAGHKIVASLDDDIQITKGWYKTVIKGIKKHPQFSIFSTLIRNKKLTGAIISAGMNVKVKGIKLYRYPIREIKDEYQITDWGPGGVVILCREALKKEIKYPRDLVLWEDVVFLLQLRQLGINKTVMITKAVAIHKGVKSPPVNNFRTYENFQNAAKYIWQNYGIDVINCMSGSLHRKLGIPVTGHVEEMKKFLDDPNYPHKVKK